MAWNYWVHQGLVTGGEYNSTEGCQPYETPPCDHYIHGSYPYCNIGENKLSTSCVTGGCTNSFYKTSYLEDLHYGQTAYQILEYTGQIQDEIYNNGPVSANFDVYDDFFYYKSGVYVHQSDNYVGTHTVKILGWGVEDGTPYWLTAKSWNTDWGDEGYFKILRDNNECGIEQAVFAGIPKFN